MSKKLQFDKPIKPFSSEHLEAIAKILADTSSGLTGAELQRHLNNCLIPDVTPEITKWKRLYNAFATFQNDYHVGNHVIVFINKALNPVLYTNKEAHFKYLAKELNVVLSFSGYQVGEDGKVRSVSKSATISEARQRAISLSCKLEERRAHSEVFKFCNEELLNENYFHAVFEASKSVTVRLRQLAKTSSDGHALVDECFSFSSDKNPKIKINSLDTETKCGEQRGFINLLKGLYGTFRNPLAHEAKIEWEMNEEDALDILSLVSLVHRKLDKSEVSN